AKIVERCCKRHGLQYNVHRTFSSGVASHFRWLREMGRRPQVA
ncbi:MAG: acyl-CoA desaturase, partial [Planctomycetes bacterium]|nr:acyl-CoA desaturase [Planctomycetota bacterium]